MKATWKLFVSWAVVALITVALVPAVALAESAHPLTFGTQGATYDLWVAGTQVTSGNAGDLSAITGVSVAEGGKASYDAQKNTLTLDNATIVSPEGIANDEIYCGIYAKGDLTIDLAMGSTSTVEGISYSGSSTISAAIGVEGGDLSITGPGSLKAVGLDNPAGGSIADSRGISVVYASSPESGQDAGGNLTIDGGATVAAIGGSVSGDGSTSYGITVDAGLAVTGGAELTATGGDAQNRSYGIATGMSCNYGSGIPSGDGASGDAGAFTIDNAAVVVDFSEIGASTTVRGIETGSLVMDNEGSIAIAVGEASVLTSMYAYGDVKMDNKSTFVVTSEDMASTTAGFTATGSLTADNESSIDIALGNSRSVTGLIVVGDVKLDNKSAIAVSGGNASSFNSVGLRAYGSATIDNGSSMDVALGNAGRKITGFTSAALLMDGESAVSVSTGNAATNNSGMELPKGMVVNGGSVVTVTTGSAEGESNSAIICGSFAEIEDGVVTASVGTGGFGNCGFVVNKGIKVGENAMVKGSAAGDSTGMSVGIVVYDGDEDSAISLGGRVSAEAGANSGDEYGSIGFAVEKSPDINPTGFFEARGYTMAVGCADGEAEDLTIVAAAVRAGEAYDGSDLADVESPFKATEDYKVVMAGAALGIALEDSEFTYDGTDKHIDNAPTSTATKGATSFSYSFEKDGTYVDDLSSLTKTDVGEYTVFVKATNPNYVNMATTTATLKIKPRKVTIASAGGSKPYDGTALAKPGVEVGGDGFVEGEVSDVRATGSVTNVAEGEVDNAITFTEGAAFKTCNYEIVKDEGKLKIAPAAVTITVASASKVEGEVDPAFTGKVRGLVADGDLGAIMYGRTNADEAPGTYEGVITAEYVANANYDVAVKNGDFTIEAKEKGSYEVVSGSDSTWDEGSDEALTFTFKRTADDEGTFDLFTGVLVDGRAVPAENSSGESNWTAARGSLVLSLQPSYLETLDAGTHTVTAVFKDGKAEASFEIAAKPAPAPAPVATHTVAFDANGHGKAPAAQEVEDGKAASKPADPTADGWVFGGWFTDKSCKHAYDFESPVTADVTLYAKWTKKEPSSASSSSSKSATGSTSTRSASTGSTTPKTGDVAGGTAAALFVVAVLAFLLALLALPRRGRR